MWFESPRVWRKNILSDILQILQERQKRLHFTKTQCDEPKLTYSIEKADAGCLCKSISKYCLLFLLNRAKSHLELFSSGKNVY